MFDSPHRYLQFRTLVFGLALLIIATPMTANAAVTAHPFGVSASSSRLFCASSQTDVLISRESVRLIRQKNQEIITVEASRADSTTATLSLWKTSHSCFVRVAGPWIAEIGVHGLSAHKSEGDGTTPIGTYSIGSKMYGVLADPGLSYPYHRLTCGDWWDEDPSSATYNTFVHLPCGKAPDFGGDSEALWQITPQYDYFAVINYNTSPVVRGRGSAIFLHRSTGEPTLGCVALPPTQLLTTLRWLQPNDDPLIIIGVR